MKWEYTVVELKYNRIGGELDLRDDLNSFGKLGWQLISTEWRDHDVFKGTTKKMITCVFKKPIEETLTTIQVNDDEINAIVVDLKHVLKHVSLKDKDYSIRKDILLRLGVEINDSDFNHHETLLY